MARKQVKSNKSVIIDAIVVQIEKGKGYSAVMAVIGRKWTFSESTFKRYWKTANERHTEAQRLIKEAKAKVDLENAINERKNEIADVNERKVILTKIARGSISFFKDSVEIVPDWTDRRNAIAELNKMEGDYAPIKNANTDTEGNDVKSPASFILNLPAGMNVNLPSNTDTDETA